MSLLSFHAHCQLRDEAFVGMNTPSLRALDVTDVPITDVGVTWYVMYAFEH